MLYRRMTRRDFTIGGFVSFARTDEATRTVLGSEAYLGKKMMLITWAAEYEGTGKVD